MSNPKYQVPVMVLKDLLNNIYPGEIPGPFVSLPISSIHCDSRSVADNSIFVALKGDRQDGTAFIAQAIQKGARVIAGESMPQDGVPRDVLFVRVDDAREFLRRIAQRFYGKETGRVKAIGVTGTNGKTTFTYLVESILKASGKECGVIGTVNYRMGSEIFATKNTTLDFLENQKFLAHLARKGIFYCVMEVSSHGLDQGRVDLIDFKTAVFTNLTGDHLDYHGDMEHYFQAKATLFTRVSPGGLSVINADDPYGQRLRGSARSRVLTYGIKNPCDFRAQDIRIAVEGSRFTIVHPQGEVPIGTILVGMHNVYNILAAAAACFEEGIGWEVIQKGIEGLTCVPGRLERVENDKGFAVFIDYAHTDDALKNVLEAMQGISHERIIAVFGCGGDRDKTKRPRMGEVASRLADRVIITNDNPRSEDPQAIARQIVAGCERNNYEVVLDRREAIHQAVGMARRGDIVLIAGKGHEDYQIFKEKTLPFKEREVVEECLACLR